MRKYLLGMCAAPVLVFQAQAALANCTQAEIVGTWRLVGTNMAGVPASPMGIICPTLVIQAGTSATKYKIPANTPCTQHVNGAAPMAFAISANNTITVNATSCAISGTFKMGAVGFSPFIFNVSGQVAENPMVGNKTSASGIGTSGASNDFITVFTLMR